MPAREVWQDAEAARRIGVVKVLWKIELGRKALCGVPLCELLKLIGEHMGNAGVLAKENNHDSIPAEILCKMRSDFFASGLTLE